MSFGVDDTGRLIDADGYWVDEHGRYVDEHGGVLGAAPGQPDDTWGPTTDPAGTAPVGRAAVGTAEVGTDPDAGPVAGSGVEPPGPAHGARRRRRRRGHPVLATIGLLLVVVVIAAVVVGVHLDHEINPGTRPGRLVSVTIPEGSSTAQIGEDLARAGVITGPSLFRYYVGIRHDGPLLGGTYHLATDESYSSAIATLEQGPKIVVLHLVIPEGFTLEQIAGRIAALGIGVSAASVESASSSGAVRSPYEPAGVDDLEGLLFPATYDVTAGMGADDILELMVGAFDDRADTIGLTARAAALGMSPYDLVTVASIVEREAKLDSDRGNVASAIYNRLRAGMPLGADSTLVYALRQRDPGIDVDTIDYNQPNPYNTRLHTGLPPTPIANPGLPSLTAAADPPSTSYLYFVEINPDGQLGFASTTSGFDALTAQCQAADLC